MTTRLLTSRHLIGEHTQKLDPFIAASTAAGLALTTLRRCFLPEDWLVHSPEGGYLRGRRASAESQRYIKLFEKENPESSVKVQCAQWAVGGYTKYLVTHVEHRLVNIFLFLFFFDLYFSRNTKCWGRGLQLKLIGF
uniref:Uncharacterized protein n=1 Tax=Meloidogyne incognita TaxID=6306 RepID=A0A914KM68_MELIC